MSARLIAVSVFLIALMAAGLFLPEQYHLRARANASTAAVPEPAVSLPEPFLRSIGTQGGEFWIAYENGKARIFGIPSQVGGCGKWKVESFGGGKIVEFNIIHEGDLEEVCFKTLAQEPALQAEESADPDALYLILLNKEVVFAGRLSIDPASPLI